MIKRRIIFMVLIIFLSVLSSIILFTIWANININIKSKNFITGNIEKVKSQKTGLVLGTSRNLNNGWENEYFFNRIEAAVELYKNGKINYIIVSGDNSRNDYNEPEDMKNELVKKGIPEEKIFLDYAGFRTLDSVIRAKEIFGQTSFIVISQKFHNERAVFIARKNGIEAYGYNAKDVHYKSYKTRVREFFARDKVFYDLIFNVEPKFYGDKINIPD